jgi:hypothetical protein
MYTKSLYIFTNLTLAYFLIFMKLFVVVCCVVETLNSKCSCLYLPSAEIINLHHHNWLLQSYF